MDNQKLNKKSFKTINVNNKDNHYDKSKFKLILNKYYVSVSLILLFSTFLVILKIYKKNNSINNCYKLNISEIYEYDDEDKEFNELTIQKYFYNQNFFCINKEIFYNSLYEKKIEIKNAVFEDINLKMFIYKKTDGVSINISKNKVWERKETKSILSALNYFSVKKNILKNDIFILDVGANIGWYSLILGKRGYNIVSFEPSKINYYILLKNYCLNKDIKVTIINKGLDNELNNCTLYHPSNNIGDAIIIKDQQNIDFNYYEKEVIKLTKLDNYLTFLCKKNLALIKLDIEGSESKALESGYDLISKYNIPFIFMEWSLYLMKKRGTDPKSLLEMLEKNGYKFSRENFLSKKYCSINELLNIPNTNIYIVYSKFLE